MIQEALSAETKRVPWWLNLMQGIVTLILGILVLLTLANKGFEGGMATVMAIYLMAIWWLIYGVLNAISIFPDRTLWGLKLFAGILGLAGLFVLPHPVWYDAIFSGEKTIFLLLGITGIVVGLIGLYLAFRGGGWVTGLIGLLSLIFGIVIIIEQLVQKPAFIWIVGILAVLGGVAAIYGAYTFKPQPEAKGA